MENNRVIKRDVFNDIIWDENQKMVVCQDLNKIKAIDIAQGLVYVSGCLLRNIHERWARKPVTLVTGGIALLTASFIFVTRLKLFKEIFY